MKKIYVAGPMTPQGNGNPAIGFLENIRIGIRASAELIRAGYAVFSPFTDFSYWLTLIDGETITEEQIKHQSLAWLSDCDAMLVVNKNWDTSKGTLAEISIAGSLNIPVFFDIKDLNFWATNS